MNKKMIGIFLVVLFVTPTLCASAISTTNVNEYDERPSKYFWRCLIIGFVFNYYEDEEYIHCKVLALGVRLELDEDNTSKPIAIAIINEEGSLKKPINDYFRGILTPHFIFGVYRPK